MFDKLLFESGFTFQWIHGTNGGKSGFKCVGYFYTVRSEMLSCLQWGVVSMIQRCVSTLKLAKKQIRRLLSQDPNVCPSGQPRRVDEAWHGFWNWTFCYRGRP